ncbi:MAG: Zn-ribbon domain-containing OB-fold protein [Candidatus Heimdallarchaeota archaeon]|nr:Zn-ribbon domain-containing OB-fold protein [Candidatus Heimdallarchaeota archaeon]MDH5646173.1 Zn-ribbon domain-containing OB-fold protein [Candidatus Heimdallarchaeota archaeon]
MSLKFGEISYEDYPSLINDFTAQLMDDKIMGTQCSDCNEKYFPPRTSCENFHKSQSMGFFEVSREAVLKGFTIIHFAPDSHADKAPYVVAIGELADGLKVLAHLVGITSQPKVGMKMKLKAQKINDERAIYKFTPV